MIEKMTHDPRYGVFEYRRMQKEQRARKELIDRKKHTKAKFSRASEVFKTLDSLKLESNKKRKIQV